MKKNTDLKIKKEKLINEYSSVYSKDFIYTNTKLSELTISLNNLETRLNEIDIEGRSISNEMMHYEELQVDTKGNEQSEQELSYDYQFTPFTEKNGIINYMGVEPDKIYLANKKTILSQEYPSYLPPVEIRRNTQYDIPAFKVKENEYLLKGTSSQTFYRVSLDVYAAVVNYHLEYDRAAFAALAKKNDASRIRALKAGEERFGIVDEKSIPLVPSKVDINSLPETGFTRSLNKEYKPSRVSLKSTKSRRMNVEPYYYIQNMSKENSRQLNRNEIFRMHTECIVDVKQKLLDMELQKADWETSWTKGRETSYGDSNLNASLLEELGITVKRQNGDIIRTKEINEVASVINRVYSIYGDVSDSSREFGLKVSHAGNTRMHASKAIGVFTSYQKAIGISFANGLSQATLTASHEYAHFLDHLSGREAHAWHSSDIPGTLENTIAVTFRKHMNSASGGYWNRTCECFARAMEEYTQIRMLRDESPLISSEELNKNVSKDAYMNYEAFEEHVSPLVHNLLLQYQNRFIFEHENAISVKEEKSVFPAVAAPLEKHSVETVLKQMNNASYAQLELFEPAAEFNAQEHEFYTKLYDYFERNVYLQEELLYLSKTPPIFQYIGIENYQINISTITLDDAQEINGLSKDEIEYSLRSISDPLLVYMAKTNEEKRYVLAIDIIKENKTIGLFMVCNEKTNQLIVDGIQTIKNEEFQLWNEDKLLQYIDETKISEWQTRKPEQISASTCFMNALSEDNVKTKSGYISELMLEHPERSFVSTDPALTREHIREAKGAMRKYGNPVLKGEKSGLWKAFRDFKKKGVFNIVGASVETDNEGTITKTGWKQMYQALNIYRDKRFETFRVLFVSAEGEVKDQLALSSYLPNKVNIEPINNALRDTIIEHAKITNTNIVLVHNHPSGNIKPSIQDENITDILNLSLTTKDNKQLLQGHIILDHNTFSVWEKEKGWSAVTSLSPSHDPLMKKRNPDFTREKIINETALSNAARQINESERWNCTDWIPVMFAGNSTKISALRYYSKEWFENQSSKSIHDEFQTIGGKTGTTWAFPVVSDELSEDESLRTAIYEHMKNGCFRDFYFSGETSKTSGLDLYGRSIFEDLTINDIRERTATEATFEIPTNAFSNRTNENYAAASPFETSSKEEQLMLFKSNNLFTLKGDVEGISKKDIGRVNGVSIEFKKSGSAKWEHTIDTDDPEKSKTLVGQLLQLDKSQTKREVLMEKESTLNLTESTVKKAEESKKANWQPFDSKKKSYAQLNAEHFLAAVKNETAPFLAKNVETPTITLMPIAVRSGETGRIFRGINQLFAQISLKEIGSKDTEIITYKQTKKHEAGIKKESKGIYLTSYNAEEKKQTDYKYYPVSAVYNRENLPKISSHSKSPSMVLFANEATPEKYLGIYLAATSLGAQFVTNQETMNSFRESIVNLLEKSFEKERNTTVLELGNKASEFCRITMSEIGTRSHAKTRLEKNTHFSALAITTEPYNPSTGEKFFGENAGKATYLMDRRKSKDPRFLELTDLLKAGLSLKKDAKEVLTVSSDGKTRFFYNAVDIEGMPPRNNVQNRSQKQQLVAEKNQNDLDMSM